MRTSLRFVNDEIKTIKMHVVFLLFFVEQVYLSFVANHTHSFYLCFPSLIEALIFFLFVFNLKLKKSTWITDNTSCFGLVLIIIYQLYFILFLYTFVFCSLDSILLLSLGAVAHTYEIYWYYIYLIRYNTIPVLRIKRNKFLFIFAIAVDLVRWRNNILY